MTPPDPWFRTAAPSWVANDFNQRKAEASTTARLHCTPPEAHAIIANGKYDLFRRVFKVNPIMPGRPPGTARFSELEMASVPGSAGRLRNPRWRHEEER